MKRDQNRAGPKRFTLAHITAVLFVCLLSVAVGMGNPPTENPGNGNGTGTGIVLPQAPPAPEPQAPVYPLAKFGTDDRLPTVPGRPPRPATGAGSVAEFIDGLSQNDAAFEVIAGQSRILTTKSDLAVRGKSASLVAIGDPTVADFQVLSARQIRINGQRIGVTDLSVITPENQTYQFEVRVVADLNVLRGQLHSVFPDASLRLAQVRDHVVVEGQARDSAQVAKILEMIQAYLASVQTSQMKKVTAQQDAQKLLDRNPAPGAEGQPNNDAPALANPERSPISATQSTTTTPRIINLISVPGSKQVLLKVRVAELNRTAFRQIGSDLLFGRASSGTLVGTQIGGASVSTSVKANPIAGLSDLLSGGVTTGFGIFERADFAIMFSALRRNSLLKVLAEPNLVALNGHTANFLAGGEFPVPVPQSSTGAGSAPTVTVQFREFGVRLAFLPTILDADVIRLSVNPEVSTIDPALGTTLVAGGSPVPGLSTRRVQTTVELRQGQTLAIAGLLQLTMDGSTQRIPLMGDLPVLGPFFSNTTNGRVEKELIVLVTPYLVEAVDCNNAIPSPGDEVMTPNDWEFYFLNRIEGRNADWRATTKYERQLPLTKCQIRLDAKHINGPCGFCN